MVKLKKLQFEGVEKEKKSWLATNTEDWGSRRPKKTSKSMKKMI